MRYFFICYQWSDLESKSFGYGNFGIQSKGFPSKNTMIQFADKSIKEDERINAPRVVIMNITEFRSKSDYVVFWGDAPNLAV